MRFVSPVQFTKPRYVRKDIELGGVRLRKGDRIMAMLAAANMDPQIRIRNGSICNASGTGTSPSAPESTFALAINLRGLKPDAR